MICLTWLTIKDEATWLTLSYALIELSNFESVTCIFVGLPVQHCSHI